MVGANRSELMWQCVDNPYRYTIGYYGRIFEAKGKTKGGAFDAVVRCFCG